MWNTQKEKQKKNLNRVEQSFPETTSHRGQQPVHAPNKKKKQKQKQNKTQNDLHEFVCLCIFTVPWPVSRWCGWAV